MKQKKRSVCLHFLSSSNKTCIFIGFCLIFLSTFFTEWILYRSTYSSFQYQTPIIFSTNQSDRAMCSTKWYKQLNFEFNAFSVNNFEKVMFLMDDYYTNTIKNHFYKCIFFEFGTNKTLKPELLTRLGGKEIFDPNRRTLCLQCKIPIRAVHPNATIIHFLLIFEGDYTNAVNISVCRSYDSSYNFVNSRIHLENETKLNLENKNKKKSSSMIAACTQTAPYNLHFPLWINYHYKMGIDHFYIYDHARSNVTRLHRILKSYIDYNIVTIVPWYIDQWEQFQHHGSPLDWVSHQIWSQNDCIHRYGHLYSWMLISDVDEFIVPMGELTNFREVLDKVPWYYCALQILNCNFRGLASDPPVAEKDRPKTSIYRELKVYGRNENSKNFVRPHLIYYFAVHQVTLSVDDSPIFYADVEKHARLQHYRAVPIESHELSEHVIDTRILSFLNSTNESISSIILF